MSLTDSFETAWPSFEEIFDRLSSNFAGPPRSKSERPESLTLDVPLSRDDALLGGSVRVWVPAQRECPACAGHGGIGPFECARCGGTGRLAGDVPVAVRYPAGIVHGYAVSVPLTPIGIRNLYLTVRFCMT